jgi:D-cysteine desulfhydrase
VSASSALLARFPALAALPRAELGVVRTPVQQLPASDDGPALWLKRDDLSAPSLGGNKVRALEFLLGAVRAGDTVLTLGGEGSTHVLATAVYAAQLGARVVALRWPHEMHPLAHAVAAEAERRGAQVIRTSNVVTALARAWARRLTGHVHYVPIGGSTPLGALGHVNAALELAEQVRAGELPLPARLVVPLGSGGTAAGLVVGLAIAGLPVAVVGARVAPHIGSNRRRVLALARSTLRLIARVSGGDVPRLADDAFSVVHDVYGGAYGRPLGAADAPAALVHRSLGLQLDATYSAKALAAAHVLARQSDAPTLFWVTFDGRWLLDRTPAAGDPARQR